jgi:mannose-6-phosphate isomerase-like protein (cupin superfamily)
MSLIHPNADDAVVVRGVDAEILGQQSTRVQLLADGSDTHGALTSQRVMLSRGANGALPHHHTAASELFYVLDGEAQILSGDRVLTAMKGDLVVVPPNLAHAFAAVPGSAADLLIILTPGIDRFGYFRLLNRVGKGEATFDDVLAAQDLYDNHFLDSPAWQAARSASNPPSPGS